MSGFFENYLKDVGAEAAKGFSAFAEYLGTTLHASSGVFVPWTVVGGALLVIA